VPAERRPSRRRLRYAAAVLGVALLGWIAWLGARLSPWLRLPTEPKSEIETQWQVVEKLATAAVPSGDDSLLLQAVDEIGRFHPENAPDALPMLEPSDLSTKERNAVILLVRWHRARGGYAVPECTTNDTPKRRAALPIYRLGQAALYTSNRVENLPQVEAVLALASDQRRMGRLIDHSVGSSLAVMAAEWSRARGVPFPPSFEAYRPSADELRGALAREAQCNLELFDSQSRGAFSLEGKSLGDQRDQPPFGLVRTEREHLIFQQYHGRLINEALAAGDDLAKIAGLYDRAAQHPPRSVLLAATNIQASAVRRGTEQIARYDEILPRR
jgi:hypothetical protein